MKPSQQYSTVGHILFDAERDRVLEGQWFELDAWAAQGSLLGGAPGRGTTVFVQNGQQQLALRHYRRGGMLGRVLGDRYLWTGLDATRPWREWHLLAELYEAGLPVPRPVAARCVRQGLFYRADLLTERLPGRPLAEWLAESPLAVESLYAVGSCLRRFHLAGVFHADLNARNILLDEQGKVYLLDFDKGERRAAGRWQQQNMFRLKRSLEKFRHLQAGFHFDESLWQAIMAGYEEYHAATP